MPKVSGVDSGESLGDLGCGVKFFGPGVLINAGLFRLCGFGGTSEGRGRGCGYGRW